MASMKVVLVSRLSSRLQTFALESSKASASFSSLISASQSPARRISRISRLPLELGSVESMMPLHNAIASARLISSLSTETRSWALVPQGISMPL